MITQAVILAAGRGERMGALTEHLPKPLVQINGRPLMEYMVDLLVAHGVEEIGVNVCYRGDLIEKHFGNGSRHGAKMFFVREPELTGTAGGMRSVARALKPTGGFFVVSADMLVDFDLGAMASDHESSERVATLACYFRPKDQLKKSGVILFDEQTRKIREFFERPQRPEDIISQWVNSSVYIFSPNVLEQVPSTVDGKGVVDLPKHVFPRLLAAGAPMFAYPFSPEKFYQLGIDSPDRVVRAEDDIRTRRFSPIKR